ncbi:MAG: hypothetical protein K0R29_2059 [Pseudobdellovibrio sp.]|nr:hypothetical protein [Pseudobdellovibrio sp.]
MRIQTMILTVALLTAFSANAAEVTTAQGMDKIKSNMENSRKNKDEFSKSSQNANGNLAEIRKNKDAHNNQKKMINQELAKTNEAFKKLSQQEREIATLMESEKQKLNLEEKQMQMLQGQLEQLRKNQEARKAIIDDYQNQLNQAGSRKNEWKQREQNLKSQESQSNESIKSAGVEENNWMNKKAGIDKDLKNWTGEAASNQKIHDTFQGFAEGK